MLVGFAGAAGSGKDTAAKALIDDMNYVKHSFAEPLKALLNQLFGWKMSDWDSLEWKERSNSRSYGLPPRVVAQTLGTDWGRRTINPNLWIDRTLQKLADEAVAGLHEEFIVFTDIRFPNEADALRAAGGILLYVTCRDRPTGTTADDHESEAWAEWLYLFADAEIAADFGEIEALQGATKSVVQNYEQGLAPRFEPSQETNAELDRIYKKTLSAMSLPPANLR